MLKAVTDLLLFFEKSRIYLPEALGPQVAAYVNRLHGEVVGLSIYTRHEDSALPQSALDTKYQAWSRANEYLQGQLPVALAALEKEFRKLLGAEGGG